MNKSTMLDSTSSLNHVDTPVRLLEDFAEPGAEEAEMLSAEEESDAREGSGNSDLEDQVSDDADESQESDLVEELSDREEQKGNRMDSPDRAGAEHAEYPTQEPASTSGQGGDEGLAAAFSKILDHPGAVTLRDKAPILLGSESVAKRHREEDEAAAVQRAAKKLRQEMRKRGHVGVPKNGEDPEIDAQEKLLYKIANRGVVQLFNAVSKAQRAQREALASGAKEKDAKINKASFFDELRGKGTQKAVQKVSIGPQTGKTELPKGIPKQTGVSKLPKPQKGWDVLSDGFAGLQGSAALKMKDWDQQPVDEETLNESLQGSEEEDYEDW